MEIEAIEDMVIPSPAIGDKISYGAFSPLYGDKWLYSPDAKFIALPAALLPT